MPILQLDDSLIRLISECNSFHSVSQAHTRPTVCNTWNTHILTVSILLIKLRYAFDKPAQIFNTVNLSFCSYATNQIISTSRSAVLTSSKIKGKYWQSLAFIAMMLVFMLKKCSRRLCFTWKRCIWNYLSLCTCISPEISSTTATTTTILLLFMFPWYLYHKNINKNNHFIDITEITISMLISMLISKYQKQYNPFDKPWSAFLPTAQSSPPMGPARGPCRCMSVSNPSDSFSPSTSQVLGSMQSEWGGGVKLVTLEAIIFFKL